MLPTILSMAQTTTASTERSTPVRVAQVGPDHRGRGGMAAVLRAILASSLAERYEMAFIATYRTPSPARRALVFGRSLLALTRWCLGRGVRLVHVHTTVRGSMYRKSVCVLLAKALRRPVILHVHSGVGDIQAFDGRLGGLSRRLFRRAFASADRVLSVSAAGAREIERRFGRQGIEVVLNAAPLVSLPEETDGTGDGVRLIYLGGFANPVKGGHVLLEALPAVLGAREVSAVTLAGPGEPPGGTNGLLAEPRLRWVGWLDEEAKARELAAADIFLLPSTSEGLPVALLEAMSYGRAIVATRAGGMPEVLSDGEEAVLVTPGDPDALARAVRALAADPDRRRRLGRAARDRAERLNEHEVSGRLDRIYRDLAGR